MCRWLRCLVCLLVICALLVNLFSVKAEATAAGAVGIAKASLVTGNPYIIIGSALLAVGVAAGVESGAFENLIDNAVSYLDATGGWIENGTMQLLQTITEAGQTAYYVAGDFLETLRSWLFANNIVFDPSVSIPSSKMSTIRKEISIRYSEWGSCYCLVAYSASHNYHQFWLSQYPFVFCSDGIWRSLYPSGTYSYPLSYMFSSSGGASFSQGINYCYVTYADSVFYTGDELGLDICTNLDLTLGNVSSVPIDGTSARTWAPDVADRNGLYVKYNNDPEPPDDNNGNWFWRLALPLTIAELIAMTQADEWTGETPEEFPTGDTVTEFEILDRPEIDGYQGIEISPVTDPSPGTGGDSGEDPDTGGDTDPTAPGEPNPDPDPDPDPDPEGGLDPDPDPGTDPDAGGDTGSDTGGDLVDVKPVNFFLDLRNYFPFCIPFDIAAFIGALVAPAEAPVFHWELQDLSGNVYPIDVDLSPWDAHAQLFRDVQLVLFIIGLALITRNMIKW